MGWINSQGHQQRHEGPEQSALAAMLKVFSLQIKVVLKEGVMAGSGNKYKTIEAPEKLQMLLWR